MRLIVQIPCYNEEETLPQTVRDIPREVAGVDEVLILVVDDGSTDRTAEVAETVADHVVRHRRNRGLASAFRTGLDECLRLGADIIVNTDGDNQYDGQCIPALVEPILDGRADIVIGDRRPQEVAHFSWIKKRLQAIGSFVVRNVSETDVRDAVSGMRALSRSAALKINIVSSFSYTIEMLIQAGKKGMAVVSVPIRTRPPLRKSRLFKSVPEFMRRSVTTIVRVYAMYQPLRVFCYVGLGLAGVGMALLVRFFYFYFIGEGAGHIQSVVIGGTAVILGFLSMLIGLVADLINFNRHLIETTLERVRRLELDRHHEDEPARGKPSSRHDEAEVESSKTGV